MVHYSVHIMEQITCHVLYSYTAEHNTQHDGESLRCNFIPIVGMQQLCQNKYEHNSMCKN